VVNGIIYVIGGIGTTGEFLDTVGAYDPATNTWTTMAPMPTARGYFRAESVGGVVYAIGGEGAAGRLSVNEAFTPGP
jgi:N-acetylneuraminic acid mutarotase